MKYTEKDLREYLALRRYALEDVDYDIRNPIPLNGSLFDEDHADLQVVAWLDQVRMNIGVTLSILKVIDMHIRRKENQEI